MLTVAAAGANSMDICAHEEEDLRMIIHNLDAAEKGMKNIIIQTVDSDILIIILGQFEVIRQKHDMAKVNIKLRMKHL